MKKTEIADRVLAKIRLRPDTLYIDENFLQDTVNDAISDVYAYINAKGEGDLKEELITPIKDLSIIRLNLTGAEGITSSSKAGTSESYIENIPKPIRRKLQKYRRLP